MPLPQLKSLADKHGVSLSTVEGYWARCKNAIHPKGDSDGYGIVVNCVKAKLRSKKLARNK